MVPHFFLLLLTILSWLSQFHELPFPSKHKIICGRPLVELQEVFTFSPSYRCHVRKFDSKRQVWRNFQKRFLLLPKDIYSIVSTLEYLPISYISEQNAPNFTFFSTLIFFKEKFLLFNHQKPRIKLCKIFWLKIVVGKRNKSWRLWKWIERCIRK